MPLLIDKGFIQSKTLEASDVTGFSNVTENCNTEEKKTSKNGKKDVQISDIFAASNFYASWSGVEENFDDYKTNRLKITSGKDNNDNDKLVVDWQQFYNFLLQRNNPKTAGDRLRYAKLFFYVIAQSDATPLLQIPSPDKRIHAMKALASLSRFLGCYDIWMDLRQRYKLTWTTGNESLTALSRFFDDKKTMETMIQWVKDAMKVLPSHMAQCIKFNCLMGLRPNESLHAIRLIRNPETFKTYYNTENQSLEHFRFPHTFVRRTKSAYISLVEPEYLSGIANLDCKTPTPTQTTPTYEALRFRLERAGVKCHLGYCRKLYGSWLRQSGIAAETVDLLQGRVPRSVFARHYFTPSSDYRKKVFDGLHKLKEQIDSN